MLIDEVECLYEELGESISVRLEEINVIGNTNICFEDYNENEKEDELSDS